MKISFENIEDNSSELDSEKDVFEPTKGQSEALEKLSDFLKDPNAFEFGLYGYAGTGKTTVIQRAFKGYKDAYAMSAPTHKAVGVLQAMARKSGSHVDVETIHKMLALKSSWKDDKKIFIPDPKRTPPIKWYKALVIDECSMIGPDMDALIRPWIEGRLLKVIWMGDPLQLPPVTDDKDPVESRSFHAPISHTLDEVVRNGGVIAEAIADIRDNIESMQPRLARPCADDQGKIELFGSRMWFRRLLEDLSENPDADIQALAFTNRTVDWINDNVRAAFFGADAPPYVAGERLVAVETFGDAGSIVMYTGERSTVIEAKLSVEHMRNGDQLPCWELEIELEGGARELLPVLDQSQYATYSRALSNAKAQAMKNKDLWSYYYDIKERFALVRPGYATTIHKSQGSTYDRVYLAQSDVIKSASFNHILRNRLLYVGYSRTRSALILS